MANLIHAALTSLDGYVADLFLKPIIVGGGNPALPADKIVHSS